MVNLPLLMMPPQFRLPVGSKFFPWADHALSCPHLLLWITPPPQPSHDARLQLSALPMLFSLPEMPLISFFTWEDLLLQDQDKCHFLCETGRS